MSHARRQRAWNRGMVLIVVLWVLVIVSFICVSFARDMALEMDSSRYFIDVTQARLAAASAVAHARIALASYQPDPSTPSAPTLLDDADDFRRVPLIEEAPGGGPRQTPTRQSRAYYYLLSARYDSDQELTFGLIDEGAKVNVNTASYESLAELPEMTDELAQAIVDFRDPDSTPMPYGAEDEYYGTLETPYRAKNASFETLEELLLVKGVTPAVLYGEDSNGNGILDPCENDGDASPPDDDQDGELDRGLAAYVTVHSLEPNVNNQGEPRLNLLTASREEAGELLLQGMGQPLVEQVFAALDRMGAEEQGAPTSPGGEGGQTGQGSQGGGPQAGSGQSSAKTMSDLLVQAPALLERENREALAYLLDVATVSEEEVFPGLLNVSTASTPVLAALPGVTEDVAEAIDAYRRQGGADFSSVAWLLDVEELEAQRFLELLPMVTARSFQYRAHAVGVAGRANVFVRVEAVLDRSRPGAPVIYWRDVTRWGAPFDLAEEAEETG